MVENGALLSERHRERASDVSIRLISSGSVLGSEVGIFEPKYCPMEPLREPHILMSEVRLLKI